MLNLSTLVESHCILKHLKLYLIKISPWGNWTPISRVTGGDTHHYTKEELLVKVRRANLLVDIAQSTKRYKRMIVVRDMVQAQWTRFQLNGIKFRPSEHSGWVNQVPSEWTRFRLSEPYFSWYWRPPDNLLQFCCEELCDLHVQMMILVLCYWKIFDSPSGKSHICVAKNNI